MSETIPICPTCYVPLDVRGQCPRQSEHAGTVPASEHQRLQAERDEARAEVAAMRRALEPFAAYPGDYGHSSDPDDYVIARHLLPPQPALTVGAWRHARAALSSSAGSALLAEMEEMRAKAETERRRVDSLLREANEARAESATLRARLETVERERDEALAANEGLLSKDDENAIHQMHREKLRRAVEEEREACARVAEDDLGEHRDLVRAEQRFDGGASERAAQRIAAAIRARGGA